MDEGKWKMEINQLHHPYYISTFYINSDTFKLFEYNLY
jgi:hypothetical protein